MNNKWPDSRQLSRREAGRVHKGPISLFRPFLYFFIYSALFSIPVQVSEAELVEITSEHSASSRSFQLLTKIKFMCIDNVITRQYFHEVGTQ